MDTDTKEPLTIEELLEESARPLLLREKLRYSTQRRWKWLRDRPRHARYFWQRGRRGYSEADTWSLCHHLAGIIIGGVHDLRVRDLGHPIEMTSAEWQGTLFKIERAFALFLSSNGWRMTDEQQEQYDEGMALFAKWFGGLWD